MYMNFDVDILHEDVFEISELLLNSVVYSMSHLLDFSL